MKIRANTIISLQIFLQVVIPLYSWLPGIAHAIANNQPDQDTRVRLDEVGDLARARSPFQMDRNYNESKRKVELSDTLKKSPFTVDQERAERMVLPALGSDSLPDSSGLPSQTRDKQQFDAMSQNWGTYARLASSDDSGAAARGFAVGNATGYTAGALQGWLQHFGTAKVDISVDNNMNFEESSLDFLYPVYDTPSRLFYTQAGVRYADERWMSNLGIGQRHFIGSWMVGYNLFFDHDLSEGHSRAGTGLELWRDYLKLSTNGYFRITTWKDSPQINNYEARPADGFDIKAEGYIPAYPQVGGLIGFEQYYGNQVALFGHDNDRQSNPSAFSYGLTYTPVPLVELSSTYKDGDGGQSETQFGLQFNYAFGVPFAAQIDPDAVALKRSLAGSRYDLVDRNNTIVLDYRNNGKIKLSLPDTVSGKGNTNVGLQATVQSDNGLDHIAWDDSALRAAGGNIMGNGTGYTIHLPIYVPGGINTYVLSGVAYDKEGHTSSSASTAITVLTSSIDPTHVQVSTDPSTIPADGAATSILTMTMTDDQGAPLAGQAQGFTFNLSGSATQPASAIQAKRAKALLSAVKSAVIGSVSEVSPGKYQAKITAGTTAGNLVVTPYLNGSALPATTVILTADSSDVSLKSGSLHMVINNSRADGVTRNQAEVTVVDENSNPVPDVSVDWSLPSDNTTAKLTTSSSLTGPDGSTQIGIIDVSAETILLTATINGSSLSTDVTFTQSNDGAVIQANSFTVKDANTTADGVATKTASVNVVDGSNNPLTGIQVGWVVDGSAVFAGGSSTTSTASGSDGTTTITLTDTKAETVKVTVTVNGKSQSVPSTFVADSSNPVLKSGSLVITKDASKADGVTNNQAQVSVVDSQGNPVSGVSVNWSLQTGSSAVLSTTSSTTSSEGLANVNITDKAAEKVTIIAALGSSTLNNEMSFTQDNGSAVIQAESLKVADDSTPADGTTFKTASLIVVDGNGTPLNNIQVTWSVNGGAIFNNGAPTATSASGSSGEAGITLTDSKAETVTVTATVNNQSQNKTSVFAANASTAVVYRIAVTSDNHIADGSSQNSALAVILDGKNNPMPNANVKWSSTSSTVTFVGGDTVKTNQYGIATIAYTDTTYGPQTLTATLDNSKTGTATTSFAVNPANISVAEINQVSPASGTKVIADGLQTYTFKAKVVDDQNSAISGMGVTWSLSGSGAKFVGNQNKSTSGTDGFASISFTDSHPETITLTATLDNGANRSQGSIVFIGHYTLSATAVGGAGYATDDTNFNNADEYAQIKVHVVDNTTGNSANGVAVQATGDGNVSIASNVITTNNGDATFKFASTKAANHGVTFIINGDTTGSTATSSAQIVATPKWPEQISESVTLNNQPIHADQETCDESTTTVARDKFGNSYTSATPGIAIQYSNLQMHDQRVDESSYFKTNEPIDMVWSSGHMAGVMRICGTTSRDVGNNSFTVTYDIHVVSDSGNKLTGRSAHFDD